VVFSGKIRVSKLASYWLKSSLVNTPQKYKETPLWHIATENLTFRTSLTGLSVLLRNAIVIIYSRGVLQPSGIRRFGNGVSQLSPLRPVLGNGDGHAPKAEYPCRLHGVLLLS
jgi:hypothetical protein